METFHVSVPEDKKAFFIEFLKLIGASFDKGKEDNQDWADHLSDVQKKSIENGIEDLRAGRVISNDEAKKRIKIHLSEKNK